MSEFMEDDSRIVKCSIRIKTDISEVHRRVGRSYISTFYSNIGPIAAGRIKCDANLRAGHVSSLRERDIGVHKPLLYNLNDFVLLNIGTDMVTRQERVFQILNE